ncbi:MAG: right-handed parallel beta-helix repeat-containing protein [Acidimicrobiales bacterium]|nr:MAG: right-handed parallel beta-helix repeat-containing protein [Acidimicrobiales bacterium]
MMREPFAGGHSRRQRPAGVARGQSTRQEVVMTLGRTVSWVLFVFVPTTGSAVTWTVDNSGTCSDSGCAPCCTIQGAIGKASGGDIVSVADGSYPENIDFRGMASIGDITLEAAATPGNVLVSPPSGHTVRHGSGYTNTVTIEGITFDSTEAGKSCVYLDHAGDVVLRDVIANNCAYTAFGLDNTGSVTMERCTANSSARIGIQVDGASGVTLDSCTTNSNTASGVLIINVAGAVQIIDPTSNLNTTHGIDLDLTGPLTISGATITGNNGRGIWAYSTSTVSISSSSVSDSQDEGVRLENGGVADTIDSVTLTDLQSNENGDNGVSLANIVGPVTVTNCSFEDNGSDGLDIWDSELNDLVITGGHATGNDDYGYNVEAEGDAEVNGTQANTNDDRGFTLKLTGTVSFENCGASANALGEGIRVERFGLNDLDEVTITNCTANDNGLTSGGNGVYVKEVAGPVTITGVTANGNSRTNIRVDSTAGAILISDVVANSSQEEGIKIDADVGPVTVQHSTVDGNDLQGILIRKEDIDVETVTLEENSVTNNLNTGVSLSNLSATGTFDATCNDIAGNGNGLHHDSAVTVDARYIWWGDPSGPSGKGSGSGDSVWYEPGGNTLFDPWLEESCTGCNGVVHLILKDDSVGGIETYKSCYSITVGPNFAVYGPGGDLTLTARQVLFENGFSVGVDGALTVRHQ